MMDQEHAPKHDALLKKQALEAHEVQEVLGFLKRYGNLIGTGVLAAILTVLGSRLYMNHKAEQMTAAEQMLMRAQTPQQLEEIVNTYSSTPTAPVALLDLAKTLFNDGETAQARAQYERFLKEYKHHEMRPVAEMGLAYCTEADGDFTGAASQFAEFADKNSTSYLHPLAVLSIARCNQQAGQTDEARIVLEDFLAENGGTLWASLAESSLKELNEAVQPK
ncbi:MAG: tetratricopeptide repeat protein [Kiritimatiellales bacterium]|nr:tetratricopeptide repeat protein [Kiritimatiellales bacterium]